jgi:hypothetical protein
MFLMTQSWDMTAEVESGFGVNRTEWMPDQTFWTVGPG